MKVQIDVFGSFVSRDVMRYIQSDYYTLNRCIGGVPISTLFDAPIHIDENRFEKMNISQYDKRMMMIQLNRNASTLLKKSGSSVLLLDLASECMKRIIFTDNNTSVAYPDTMDKYIDSFFEGVGTSFKRISLLEVNMKLLEKKYKRFAESIVKSEINPNGYLEENIIVIEAYCINDYICNKDALLHQYDPKYKIKEINNVLKKLYGILYKYIPGCRIIKMPIFTHSTENHIRGKGPLFYTDETYQYMADCVEVFCGTSKKNSVENLYKDRGLKNQLSTRLLKIYNVCNVSELRRQIKVLNEQIDILKKQVEELNKR